MVCTEVHDGNFIVFCRFIKMLEKQKKLLRNYTQNIDTLEQIAGIDNVVECHGKPEPHCCFYSFIIL